MEQQENSNNNQDVANKDIEEVSFEEIIQTESDNDSSENEIDQDKKLSDALEKIATLEDQILRLAAEAQNVKRRAEQDVQKAKYYSVESFAKDLLSVMDNLQRTSTVISADSEDYEKFKPILEGIDITKNEMVNVFKRNGITEINPVGEKFDHNFHQAMSQIDHDEQESGTIIDVMQTGYVIKERLIRPALVVVVK